MFSFIQIQMYQEPSLQGKVNCFSETRDSSVKVRNDFKRNSFLYFLRSPAFLQLILPSTNFSGHINKLCFNYRNIEDLVSSLFRCFI